MEIPVLNRITDFEAPGMSSLPTPSHISQALSVSGVVTVSKWGPLLLLALAAALLNTLKLFVFKLRRVNPLPHSQQPLLDYDSGDDASSSGEDPEEEECEWEEDDDDCRRRVEEDFRVRGGSGDCVGDEWQSRKLRLCHRRSIGDMFSWSELAAGGKSVVKIWDNLGLGFDLLDGGDGYVNFVPGDDVPPVVISAGANGSRNIELKVWDRRVSCRVPAILAEWRAQSKKIGDLNAASGFEKFIIGGAGELTVGDLRKANAPLDKLTDSDADAVMLAGDFLDTLAVRFH